MPKPTKLSDLPDGWLVAFDTETSGTDVDDGARASIVSWAYRDPADGQVVSQAVAFDQGQDLIPLLRATTKKGEDLPEDIPFGGLPLGPKDLPLRHSKRIRKWVDEHGATILQAPNLPPGEWGRLIGHLLRMRLVAHNAKFDAHIVAAGLRGCEGKPPEGGGGAPAVIQAIVADTQLSQYVLDPQKGTALKSTSVRLKLGKELGLDEGTEDEEQQALKPWRGPQTDPRFDLIPWSVIRPYAALDAALTLLLFEQQTEFLEDPAYQFERRHTRREFNLMRTLYAMERRGIGYDRETSLQQAQLIDTLSAQVASLLPFKPTYPGAQKFFFGEAEGDDGQPTGNLGHLPYDDKLTQGGAPQVDEETISRLVQERVSHAEVFQRYAELQSAKSKWYQSWADFTGEDGRLRTNHKQASVVSGRLAVSRVQLHAIPQPYKIPSGLRPVRELFVPKAGHELWEVDVSQAEIRIATAVARCQPMLDQFNAGLDSHDAATLLMFSDEVGGDWQEAKRHPMWVEYRQIAKRCNLGILYGAGAGTIRKEIKKYTGIDYPLARVRSWVEEWRAAFPQFVKLLDAAGRKASRDGWVRLINGRMRWFSAYEPTHKAANQIIQGSQAEVIKDCLVRVEREIPGVVLLCIHDSLVLELPLQEVDTLVARVQAIMVEEFERAFTRPWTKGGEPVTVPFRTDAKRFSARRALEEEEAVA